MKRLKVGRLKILLWYSIYYTLIMMNSLLCMTNNAEDSYGYVLPDKTKNFGNITVEKVVIFPQERHNSEKKISRNGILVRNATAKATVLICHGFMCDKHDSGMLRKIFKKSDFNVMTFDFRAHGENAQGQYCTFGRDEALDVVAAARFLKNYDELNNVPLFVYGFSMGAVSAIEAQALADDLFEGMILDCPFDSSAKVIESGLEGLKFSIWGYEFEIPGRQLLQKYAFHPYVQSLVKKVLGIVSQMDASAVLTNFCPIYPVESIKKITIPCFFIHCKNDEKVSVDQVKAVYNGAAGYKRLWVTNGRRHCDSVIFNPEKYRYYARQFLNNVLNGDIHYQPQEDMFQDEKDDEFLF